MGARPVIANFSPVESGFLQEVIALYSDLRDIDVVNVHRLPEAEIIDRVKDAVVLFGDFTFQTPITREIIRAAKNAKLIQQPTEAVAHIDRRACAAAGLPLANAAGANEVGAAEHIIMTALCLLKKLTYLNQRMHRGEWLPEPALEAIGVFEAYGKTFGLIGMGRIGRAVAERLKPFGLRAVYYDPRRLTPQEEEAYALTAVDMDRLLAFSDLISLHLSLTDDTRGLIGAKELAAMKKTALLIQVGRGGLIDEAALFQALKSGAIAGAALDGFAEEPIPKDYPLLGLENVILTPQAAGATNEARPRQLELAIKNLIRVLRGEAPDHLVNV